MIELAKVNKNFGSKLILDIPAFELDNGIYWIQGINGSGKTTFLKILSGIIPFSGDVSVNSTSLKKKPVDYRKLVSYAEAEPLYPAYLSGQEIIDFYAYIKKEKKKDIDTLVELFRAEYYINLPIGTYSSGMLKKLSLILAFVGRPQLILLDEPLVTLDAETIPSMYNLVKESHLQFGTSFLVTSHQDFPDNEGIIKRKIIVENQTLHFTQ
jgi:ABC-2 type transport system ATP-binding protein